MPLTPQEHAEKISSYRVYYNRLLEPIGFQSPTPKAGQRGGEYRRQALQTFADSLLPQSHTFAQMPWTDKERMPYDVLKNFEPQLLQHCVTEYQNPANVPYGTLREITKTTTNGAKTITFVGQDCFVKFMGRPGRRVTSFRTDQGYVDASGRGLR
jgi:hypothetical protein